MNAQRIVLVLMIATCWLILAACSSSGEEPAPTVIEAPLPTATDTGDPTEEPTIFSPLPTFTPRPTLDLPDLGPTDVNVEDTGQQPGGIGTLVSSPTENPDLPAGFDRVVLQRTGGPADSSGTTQDEVIVIMRDGSMTRNSAEGRASQTAIDRIGIMIDEMNFFGVQANFIGPVPLDPPYPYVYIITVTKGFNERSISGQDGYMPQPLELLIATVMETGLSIQNQ